LLTIVGQNVNNTTIAFALVEKSMEANLVDRLGEAGIEPNDIMVFFLETDRASGSFGGGQFALPVAFV
jgi:hypothetical protein